MLSVERWLRESGDTLANKVFETIQRIAVMLASLPRSIDLPA